MLETTDLESRLRPAANCHKTNMLLSMRSSKDDILSFTTFWYHGQFTNIQAWIVNQSIHAVRVDVLKWFAQSFYYYFCVSTNAFLGLENVQYNTFSLLILTIQILGHCRMVLSFRHVWNLYFT